MGNSLGGLYLTIGFASLYGLIIISTSVACAVMMSKNKHKRWYGPILAWAKLVKQKKDIYISILPHLFDQATDLGVIWQYYLLSYDAVNNQSIDPDDAKIYLFGSIGVIVFYRTISCIGLYHLNHNIVDVVLQIFELAMVKAIWVNYKVKRTKKANPQRLLQTMVCLCHIVLDERS